MQKKYRLCAGCVVFNREGNVLLGNRIDMKSDSWQFPQGGIELDETPEEAAKRELFEETNVTSVKTVYSYEHPLRYDFPTDVINNFLKRGIISSGQDIYFSLFFFDGNDSEISAQTSQPEFKELQWHSLDFAVENIVYFKRGVYKTIAECFKPIIVQYLGKRS